MGKKVQTIFDFGKENMKKTVLITGAFGFIGGYVTRKLLNENYHVVALTHTKGNVQNNIIDVIEADISDENVISKVMYELKHCDVVIHLAANLKRKSGDSIIGVNCNGTYHLIQLATMLNAEKFIYISSIPVIGSPKIIPITEEHSVNPESLYHISKYMGEQMINALCPVCMKKIILRIPSPIGIGMNPNNFLSILFDRCLCNKEVILYGQGLRVQNYIDVRDVAEAINKAIKYNDSDLFLLAGERSISNKDLAFLCKEITGSNSKIVWGRESDPDEKKQWIISTEKIYKKMNFMPQQRLTDSLKWIYEKRIEA